MTNSEIIDSVTQSDYLVENILNNKGPYRLDLKIMRGQFKHWVDQEVWNEVPSYKQSCEVLSILRRGWKKGKSPTTRAEGEIK